MDEHLTPRPDPRDDRPGDIRNTPPTESQYGAYWPVLVLVVAMLLGVLLFSSGGNEDSGTRVGQNAERNMTPDTPRTPSAN